MTDEILLVENEEGLFEEYDDTYDVIIHCENKEEQENICKKLTTDKWIPVQERLPESGEDILLSFENFPVPDIGIYEADSDGSGAFYPGDDEKSYVEYGLFVNAWMPLPECYRAESEE